MKTYRQMTREELMQDAQQFEHKHRCHCTVYQTADGDAGLHWNAQQVIPTNTVWSHTTGARDCMSE